MKRLTIALDAMGGDFGPAVIVPAALQVLVSYPQLKLILVGSPSAIRPLLTKTDSILLKRLTIVPTELVITSNAIPSQVIKRSYGTSMRIALELIKNGQAQACVSAGNTGALMMLAKLVLKPMCGIERPALMVFLPHKKQGKTIVLDVGANIACNGNVLVQFAVMGSIIAENITHGSTNPRVALLNIGKEKTKGIDSIQNAATLLRDIPSINYIGYLEANELLMGKTDVLVCDGFIGNVILKTIEGMIKVYLSLMQSYGKKSGCSWWLAQWINKWIRCCLMKQLDQLNPDQYNGACLIGLHGIVIKSHGSANQCAFASAIKQAIQAVEQQISERIAAGIGTILPKK